MAKKFLVVAFIMTTFCVVNGYTQVTESVKVDESTDTIRANSLEWVEVLGEVINNSTQIIGYVKVTITLKSSTGQILDTGFTFVSGKDVEVNGSSSSAGIFPGEKAPFSKSFSSTKLADVATVEYIVSYDIAGPRTDTNETSIVTRIASLETAFENLPSGGGTDDATKNRISTNEVVIGTLKQSLDSLKTDTKARIDKNSTVIDSIKNVIVNGQGGSTSNTIPGDINSDGRVGFEDFLILAQNFGKQS
jgi:hypothetical protein